ncbi:hypothetical protein ACNKHQ_11120 [Shigella flexneri]
MGNALDLVGLCALLVALGSADGGFNVFWQMPSHLKKLRMSPPGYP